MSVGLPDMVYSDGITKKKTVSFTGYRHEKGAGDGTLWDMKNLTGDDAPLLSTRAPRYLSGTLTEPNGLYARDGLFFVDGERFYDNWVVAGHVTHSKKHFAGLGAYVIILPDKLYYNRLTGEFGGMESSWSGSASLQDGTYAGESAEGNTIYAIGVNWADLFSVGDGVTISGATVHPENNKTIIIREIDGEYLRFYENSFTLTHDPEMSYSWDGENSLTVKRAMPDMDYLCENENRLWGCKGDTIYASKLGDIFNWNVFDGLSTDSYAVNVGSEGDFTAACSYLGYPCFFKEDHIYKVYGDSPSAFQVMGSASLGVAQGSSDSCAIAGEVLFYLSRAGVVAYSGGVPANISKPFGTERYRDAVGGSDGRKYYISMLNAAGEWNLFVYDTETGLWHMEDNTKAIGFGWQDELYMLDGTGKLWRSDGSMTVKDGATPEPIFSSMAEFGDFVENDPNRKGVSKLQLRIELEPGAKVIVLIQFDSDGIWREVKTLGDTVKRSYYLPIVPRRCDHFRLKLEGTGQWKLFSLVRESYSGSEL